MTRTTTLLGLMSGTSLDGVTAAVVRFVPGEGDALRAELIGWNTTPYSSEQRERLAAAMHEASPAEYCRLRVDIAHWFADAAMSLMAGLGLGSDDVDAIASHGQTIWHEPGHSSWQIGDPATSDPTVVEATPPWLTATSPTATPATPPTRDLPLGYRAS